MQGRHPAALHAPADGAGAAADAKAGRLRGRKRATLTIKVRMFDAGDQLVAEAERFISVTRDGTEP